MNQLIATNLGLVVNASGDGVGVDQTLSNGVYVAGKKTRISGEGAATFRIHIEFKGGMTSATIKLTSISNDLDPSFGNVDLQTTTELNQESLIIEHTYADPGGSHILDDILITTLGRLVDQVFLQVKAAGVLSAADIVRVRGVSSNAP
jgi:hypothetical protein